MRTFSLVAFCFALLQFSGAQTTYNFYPEKILHQVEFLASDSLKGRKPGTPESKVAADFILEQFVNAGLKPLADAGFQYFDLITDVEPGSKNSIMIDDKAFEAGKDFIPLPFSDNRALAAHAVFAGYGFDIKNDTLSWNDYQAFDVEGKWVLLLRGMPVMEGWEKLFESSASERFKVMTAKDKGAAGVIFISGKSFDKDDELIKMSFDRIASNSGLPVIHAKRSVFQSLFESINDSISGVEKRIAESKAPVNYYFNKTITAQTDIIQNVATTKNVVAMLEGADPVLKNEFVVIGAHYDHLGFGGPGSGSRVVDTIAVHYGADDNASGVAGVMSLARFFSQLATPPARSIIFVAFGAEEVGLIGSKFFVENPLINVENIVSMINFDMIGRLRESNVVSIGGTGTSVESEMLLSTIGKDTGLELKFSQEGYGPSDHAAFYSKDIPVFFISTGAHSDYHTPRDVASAINTEGMVRVIALSSELALELSNRNQRLTFQEAGPKSRQRHGSGYKVTLGIMPDFTDSQNTGLKVDAVRPDGPARSGGMKKGDLIVAINGKSVQNIYDYMGRLKDLEAGQSVIVDVMRDGKKEILLIQL